jgi:dedicated sortase system histidine kinase
MSLRIQLLILGLLTLSLPWATYQYVRNFEGSFRSNIEQSLLERATTISKAIATNLGNSEPEAWGGNTNANSESTVYAHKLERQPELNSSKEDWGLPDGMAHFKVGTNGTLWLGLYGFELYLFLSVSDNNLAYETSSTSEPTGDRVILLIEGGENLSLLLHPASEEAQHSSAPKWAPSKDYENRVKFSWKETQGGYVIEALMPLQIGSQPIKRIGISVVNANADNIASDAHSWTNGITPNQIQQLWQGEHQPGKLFYPTIKLASAIGQVFNQQNEPNRRLRVTNMEGWKLFDGGSTNSLVDTTNNTPLSLSERFYRFIIGGSDPLYDTLEVPLVKGRLSDTTLRAARTGESQTTWYSNIIEESAIVMAAVPISLDSTLWGAVVLEQSSDAILTLKDKELVWFINVTLVSTLLVLASLLSYATWLSLRVQKLAQAADNALGPKGEIRPDLPGNKARDEIGDLSRSFTHLLDQVDKNTNYLITLKGKLSHELRTPLSVVASSLENIEQESQDTKLTPYLERLRKGVQRLENTLNSMNEATRMEQMISSTKPEVIDLLDVLPGCLEGYRGVHQNHSFIFENTAPQTNIDGSGELIEQMLDKLIDNAASFSPNNSPIKVILSGTQEQVFLSVTNKGPSLPKKIRAQLFDPLVSMRKPRDKNLHLGLGLNIVELVVKFHNGKVQANDLQDGTGVRFEITLPARAG